MVQKLSIDPNIVDNKILENSLNKIGQGFQNLIEIKKMENPSIFINNTIKQQIFRNISQMKFFLNEKITESEEYKKLSNISIRVETLMHELLNSPEFIYKFQGNNLNKVSFKEYISRLYNKFGSTFLDYILVEKIIESGFKEIDGDLGNYLEKKNNSQREYFFSKDINNFGDFSKIVLDKLGFDKNEKNQKIYLINPGILRTIDNYIKDKHKYRKKFLDTCTTIKCICYYLLKLFKNVINRPTIVIATDNPGNKLNENSLTSIFLNEFEEFKESINVYLVVTEKWAKKSKKEQRFIFSSNEFGFASNVDLDFLRKGMYGTNESDYKSIKENYTQFKVAKDGILTEISNPSYKNFVNDHLIENIENKLNTTIHLSEIENTPKNQAFLHAFKKLRK